MPRSQDIIPWAFALNHRNYVRQLPIHITCMINLKKDEQTYAEFIKGKFTAPSFSENEILRLPKTKM